MTEIILKKYRIYHTYLNIDNSEIVYMDKPINTEFTSITGFMNVCMLVDNYCQIAASIDIYSERVRRAADAFYNIDKKRVFTPDDSDIHSLYGDTVLFIFVSKKYREMLNSLVVALINDEIHISCDTNTSRGYRNGDECLGWSFSD